MFDLEVKKNEEKNNWNFSNNTDGFKHNDNNNIFG